MWRRVFWLSLFAIAMGLLEAIVVIYLRWLYYPQGFDFPLHLLPWHVARIEVIREACTLVMIVAVGWLAGKNFSDRLAFFLLAFAIWDIVYYIGLKIFLNWPPSLLTWDLLFLIPVVWGAPVLAPVISALTMIILSAIILYNVHTTHKVNFYWKYWIFIFLGAFLEFIAFIWDFTEMIIKNGLFHKLDNISKFLMDQTISYKPQFFHWDIFIIGELLIIIGLVLMFLRIKRN